MKEGWRQILLPLPGIGVSILPNLVCPMCMPTYAAVLSSAGLGFLGSARYLLPVNAFFLVVALGALAFKANNRNGYGPFWLGLLGGFAILLGKFAWSSNMIVYCAASVLGVAAIWNMWPRRAGDAKPDCCGCDPTQA